MDKIHLFLHDAKSENMLRLLKPQEELNVKTRDLIEIVLSCKLVMANTLCCTCN